MKKIKYQNVQLKKEVDQHTEKLETELIKKWDDLHRCTEKEEKDVSLLIGSLESKKSEVDEIIQSMEAETVFVDGFGLTKSKEETVASPCTKFDSIPIFLPGQITAYNIGLLENVCISGEIKVFKQFDTEILNVYAMTACSEDMFWITDFKVLQKVKIKGSTSMIFEQKAIICWDMACTPSKDLLLADGGAILKRVSEQTGEVTSTKYEVKGLRVSHVHVNQYGDVTVSAFRNYIGWKDTSKIGLIYPRSFCSTEAGHTYVGCVTSKNSRDIAKLYEIIIS
ncbi:unnamed protein product [Mytilus edulis]|uniref:Uncharacterized protein n=1 Tax=Mytilus edulis TaxID=6550 RepID=A0A8S3RLV3_MYTED|nr:unnamed protein product [Mytilus edulis]